MCASLPQPGGDVEQPVCFCANMTSSTKPEIRHSYHYGVRGETSHGHRYRAEKFGEDRTCSSGDIVADKHTDIHTDRQTDRQTHSRHNSLRSPIGGGVITSHERISGSHSSCSQTACLTWNWPYRVLETC